MSDPLTPDQIKANAREFAKTVQSSLVPNNIASVTITISKNGITITTVGDKPPKPIPEPT